jgi:hypothetical protein
VGTYFEENRLTDLVMSDFPENAPTAKSQHICGI